MNVIATHILDKIDAADTLGIPGAFQFEANDKGIFYVCPCGCQSLGFLGFRGLEDKERPSWEWDGNREKPTLSPSILRRACGWHGFLRGGAWESC